MKRFVCIHGHFYQPPRENPWLEAIETQDAAHPYHDWNDRITTECYAPNAASRILGPEGKIQNIVNNYSRISFNFGPTLLSWLEKNRPDVYEAILRADRESMLRFSGHGSALAQVYNHIIMPLANRRDQETQVIWGIRDFISRFKRPPEGMWLPETAVNLAVLEVLKQHDIRFTILAPHQAYRIRRLGEQQWIHVGDGRINPKRPYLCRLSSGKNIVLFFYDGPIAHEVSFGNILNDGGAFADRLTAVFSPEADTPQLVHIATDGESYGHHHRFGDMALAYCLDRIESNKKVELTIYGEYLDHVIPQYEVEIYENTSWSCVHGIERWRDHCGCHSGLHPRWKQLWRKPLRNALEALHIKLANLYEQRLAPLVIDPWHMRNEYIDIILDREQDRIEAFLRKHLNGHYNMETAVLSLKLLEMQRHSLLMFTSCGWFFDDIAGIESKQILLFAARAIQLAQEFGELDLEEPLKRELAQAPGNQPEYLDGQAVWNSFVKPSVIDLLRVGVHVAVSSLFQPPNGERGEEKLYCYQYRKEVLTMVESGKEQLLFGKIHIRSTFTWEELTACFAMVYFGDYNLMGGVRKYLPDGCSKEFADQLKAAFNRLGIPEIVRLMDGHFGTHHYTFRHLFRDEQRQILEQVMSTTLGSVESTYRQIYEQNYPIMQIMRELQIPLPKAVRTAGEYILNRDMISALAPDVLDFEWLSRLVEEMKQWSMDIDRVTIGYVAENTINRLIDQWVKNPEETIVLEKLARLVGIFEKLPIEPDFGYAQNLFFQYGRKMYSSLSRLEVSGEERRHVQVMLLRKLAEYLRVSVS
ncbi:MAG TPA: DUF3536 domain-containing protein [Atribacteraceae bacterium]|nr:DUF3536 domain-containing protein [Atribacteraceae bacterium]